jgi:hypothetical protein
LEHGTRGGPDQSADNVETPAVRSSRIWAPPAARATSDLIPLCIVWLVGVDPVNVTQRGHEPEIRGIRSLAPFLFVKPMSNKA